LIFSDTGQRSGPTPPPNTPKRHQPESGNQPGARTRNPDTRETQQGDWEVREIYVKGGINLLDLYIGVDAASLRFCASTLRNPRTDRPGVLRAWNLEL
jgi:hypothetical protein